jgi:hypothetical protein
MHRTAPSLLPADVARLGEGLRAVIDTMRAPPAVAPLKRAA